MICLLLISSSIQRDFFPVLKSPALETVASPKSSYPAGKRDYNAFIVQRWSRSAKDSKEEKRASSYAFDILHLQKMGILLTVSTNNQLVQSATITS